MTDRTALLTAFIHQSGWGNATRLLVAGDASNRRYERLTKPDGSTLILMDAPADKGEDVRPFIAIAEHLNGIDLSAPAIMHRDIANGFLLIEDLGDDLPAPMSSIYSGCQANKKHQSRPSSSA